MNSSYMENCKIVAIAQNSPEWLEWRNGGIGGSEIAAILGASKWATALSVWAKKTGIDKTQPEENENMEWGHRLESVIADKWLDKHQGYSVEIRGPVFERTDMSWMRASLDVLVLSPDGLFEALECKSSGNRKDWFGEAGEEIIPEYYFWQAIWQMAVTGVRTVHLSILLMDRSRSWIERTVVWDDSAIKYATAMGSVFWGRVISGEYPQLDNNNPESDTEALKALFPQIDESLLPIDLGAEGEVELDMLAALKAQIDSLEKVIEAKKNWFKIRMGAHKACTANGRKVCNSFTAERTTVDGKALKSGNPEVFERYSKKNTYKTYRFAV